MGDEFKWGGDDGEPWVSEIESSNGIKVSDDGTRVTGTGFSRIVPNASPSDATAAPILHVFHRLAFNT